jgi:hypothetical protein
MVWIEVVVFLCTYIAIYTASSHMLLRDKHSFLTAIALPADNALSMYFGTKLFVRIAVGWWEWHLFTVIIIITIVSQI